MAESFYGDVDGSPLEPTQYWAASMTGCCFISLAWGGPDPPEPFTHRQATNSTGQPASGTIKAPSFNWRAHGAEAGADV